MNNEEQGVRGYGGRLDIRPPYQREFIYNEKEQQAVITTVLNGYPLNVMYWVKRGNDAECPYEVMDGQQRTLSLCEYVAGKFSYEFKNFFNQPKDIQRKILDYRLTVYVCEGEPSEKLEWFRTINIAGKPLNEQEINNAVYAGPFVSDAKRHFSKSNCGAYRLAKDLVTGTPIRQDFLKKALEWMAGHETREGKRQTIVGYMAEHQHDPNANALWLHFQNVVNWVRATFPKYRKEMKGVAWGTLWRRHHERQLDVAALEQEVKRLMADSDVQKKKGIKLLEVSLLSHLGKGRTPESVYADLYVQAEEEGWSDSQLEQAKKLARWDYWGFTSHDVNNFEELKAAHTKFAKALCDSLVVNEWDGFDIDWEPGSGFNDADGTLANNPRQTDLIIHLVKEMGKYIGPMSDPENKGHKLLCVDGVIGTFVTNCPEYIDYFILQSYGRVDNLDGYAPNTHKFILTENFESSAVTGGQLLRQAAYMPSSGYKGGVGAYRFQKDYDNTPDYKWMRKAIQENQRVFNEWKAAQEGTAAE